MMVTFGKHGTGSAQAAVDYLLGERDAAGIMRSHVEVLRGDPALVADLADSRDQVWRYSAGVIAWHSSDLPTREQIDSVLDDFEVFTSAGLSEPMTWAAVQYGRPDDEHGVHVHFLIARHDTGSGKAWNPAPPGWEKDFAPWQDLWNAERSWADPRGPDHARTVQLPGPAYRKMAAARRGGAPVAADIRESITADLTDLIVTGQIRDRDQLVDHLRDVGWQIHRQSAHYLSVRAPEESKSIRLKGGIYDSDFWTTAAGESGGPAGAAAGPDQLDDGRVAAAAAERSDELRARVRERLERRTAFHARRVPNRPHRDPEPVATRSGEDPDGQPADDALSAGRGAAVVAADSRGGSPAAERELGVLVLDRDSSEPDPDGDPDSDQGGAVLGGPDRTELDDLQPRRKNPALPASEGVTHDRQRTRSASHRILDALDRALGGAERTNREADQAAPGSALLGRASRALARAGELLDRAVERVARRLARDQGQSPKRWESVADPTAEALSHVEPGRPARI